MFRKTAAPIETPPTAVSAITLSAANGPAPLAYDTVGAAKALGIGRSTVFEEIAAGRLDARKVGRRTVISREACLAWLAALPSNREARAA